MGRAPAGLKEEASMFRLTHLTAGVLALALLIAIPAAATGLVSNGAHGGAGSVDRAVKKKACKKGTTRNKSGRCVKRKPCTKRQTRNRNGKCVNKRTVATTGVVPPDDLFGYKSADGVVFVEIDQRKISQIRVRVPLANLTCTPEGSVLYPRTVGILVQVYDLAVDPRTGAFAKADHGSDGGDGNSEVQGRFLSQKSLTVTATTSELHGYAQGPLGVPATCAGTNTVTVNLVPR
jgi:hypothetical protein